MYYILEGKTFRKAENPLEFARWFGTADRHVDKTTITDDIEVSTVFLAIDHGYYSDVPILFETMIFGGNHDEYQRRYATWEEAEIGHLEVVTMALCGLTLDVDKI